ncbi:hypothetical protein DKZ22_10710 [Limosilactobacillus reuteri]|uniref:Uncharacterized protein n=1 Tax=Limosilactobacillus reuteri TaxID=1598 RepID=A0A855X9B6_LIMRT|nr:hypothetical protein DKZ22_10710 [Limosilactobacillus reuteri]PWT68233.1 hypothetical protein DKZ26_10305 [Limosilactobacillus reuteri]
MVSKFKRKFSTLPTWFQYYFIILSIFFGFVLFAFLPIFLTTFCFCSGHWVWGLLMIFFVDLPLITFSSVWINEHDGWW